MEKVDALIKKNNLYPVFLKLDELNALVVGGGNVGLEKVSALLFSSPDANVTVVAPAIKSELKEAIVTGHVGILKSVKGIGEKSAQRIIVDLKDKIDRAVTSPQKVDFSHNTIREESLSGLVILGFPKKVAEKAVDEVIKELRQLIVTENEAPAVSVERIIKEALKRL